jgi:hypothetical protein
MFYLWGKNSLSVKMYHLLTSKEQENTCFIETNPQKAQTVFENSICVLPDQIRVADVEKILIPTYGSMLEKNILKAVRERGIDYGKIWIMDYDSFAAELRSCGSLAAFMDRKTIPFLHFLEFEVTHHCNLKCKGCTHFAPLSEVKYGNLEEFIRDLTRVHELIDHIGEIRLLGGEPLLNDELYRFVEEARGIYPDSVLSVVTNGIKLAGISDRLKETMKRTQAQFSITLYPPVKTFVKNVADELTKEGIPCIYGHDALSFTSQLRLEGDSNAERAELTCMEAEFHTIEGGRISKCSITMKMPVFKKHYGLDIDFPDDTLDLYDESLTAEKLFAFLSGPVGLCSYCGKGRSYPWEKAGANPPMEDWIGSGKYE